MTITQSQTRSQFPLSSKKIIKKTIANSLTIILILVVAGGMLVFNLSAVNSGVFSWLGSILGILLVILLVFILATYFYQRWYFATYFYELTADYVQIKKGPLTPREITVPYERIQDIYVDQDILDRIFGLYDVHLSSATVASGMEAHIDGVEKAAADSLRALLLKTVQQKIGRSPVEKKSTNSVNINN